ncbi:hypothetical protein [Geminocystis sp. GBBB08]
MRIFLDILIDEVRENETHPLISLMEIITMLIKFYQPKISLN